MKLPTISVPVIRNDRFKGEGKVTASLGNPETTRKCTSSCDGGNNHGYSSLDSCVHECYWETESWKSTCGGARYC
jgi:hypothetical protein